MPLLRAGDGLLDRKGVAYQEIEAPHGSEEREEATRRSGRSSVPQIFIGDRHIGGCDDLVALDRVGPAGPVADGSLTLATPP